MTHEELVRFAAGKVGWKAGFKDSPIYGSQWYQLDMEGHIIKPFDLTSPELFLKGLRVLDEEGVGWLLTSCEWEMWKPCDDRPLEAKKHIPIVDMHLIPLYFWQCWAELEGGQG